MDFQRARTKEQVETRVEEIVQACKTKNKAMMQ